MKISQERLRLLNYGKAPANNLAEDLAIDFATLMAASIPSLPENVMQTMHEGATLGIVQRMSLAGELLYSSFGVEIVPSLQAHLSDSVRSWACFVLAKANIPSFEKRLESIRPFADDSHFGVREWAWLAMRNHIASNLEEAISLFALWTNSPSERIRRFASESTRPRGVWCTHIDALKKNPELGLPILEALKCDQAQYVQDSIANWLNDASKTQPEWVQATCARWKKEHPSTVHKRVFTRALRSINK